MRSIHIKFWFIYYHDWRFLSIYCCSNTNIFERTKCRSSNVSVIDIGPTIQNFTSFACFEALCLIQFVSQNHCKRRILVRLPNRNGDRIHALWKLPTYSSKPTSANIRWRQWQNGGPRCKDTATILCLYRKS